MTIPAPILLDACVLAESALSDLLLRLSEGPALLSPRWTAQIWAEARRTLIDKLGWPEAIADSRVAAACEAFAEASITGYEPLIEPCTNDPKDRHVLAAAIHSRSSTIVTFNVRHFRSPDVEALGIVAVHPDDYLLRLYGAHPMVVVETVTVMAVRRNRSVGEMLSRLSVAVPALTTRIADDLGISFSPYEPPRWRRE